MKLSCYHLYRRSLFPAVGNSSPTGATLDVAQARELKARKAAVADVAPARFVTAQRCGNHSRIVPALAAIICPASPWGAAAAVERMIHHHTDDKSSVIQLEKYGALLAGNGGRLAGNQLRPTRGFLPRAVNLTFRIASSIKRN
ncbi:unnamed protein product, partial [Iphiclides podalirius]